MHSQLEASDFAGSSSNSNLWNPGNQGKLSCSLLALQFTEPVQHPCQCLAALKLPRVRLLRNRQKAVSVEMKTANNLSEQHLNATE